MSEIKKVKWQAANEEKLSDTVTRQVIHGGKATLSKFSARKGADIARHSHPNEEYMMVTSGAIKYLFDDREEVVNAGEVLVVPPDVPHSIHVLEDVTFLVFFTPVREDWLRGEDQYLRR